ncbi:hypothetical protein MESS4_p20061 [Mesorhizobium sp. STM 4661]|nr:hypothetical protein MESS4_p20061 [Mesorhizobium sp. STM 4661]
MFQNGFADRAGEEYTALGICDERVPHILRPRRRRRRHAPPRGPAPGRPRRPARPQRRRRRVGGGQAALDTRTAGQAAGEWSPAAASPRHPRRDRLRTRREAVHTRRRGTEIYPDDPDIAFSLCNLGVGCPELGSVSLSELGTVRGKLGLPVGRDLHFRPLSELSAYADHAQRHGAIRT